MPCCSKIICGGCYIATVKHKLLETGLTERGLENKCLFCRHPAPKSETEFIKIVKKRIEVNDPAASCELSTRRYAEGDFDIAIEYWTKAAGLGEAKAHNQLSVLYHLGQGVEKDEEKEFYHLEEAAIGGQVDARYHLGVIEWKNKRFERAVTHSVIAANVGHDAMCNTSAQRCLCKGTNPKRGLCLGSSCTPGCCG